MSAVEAVGVKVAYGNHLAIAGVDLSVPIANMVALLGPNGSGKSTLLKVLAGLLSPTAGTVRILGVAPGKARSEVAYVPQREEVYWDYPLTVWDIAAMGRIRAVGQIRSVPRGDERVWKSLELVGMVELAHRRLSELSGGQQQRTFLARAISQGGEILLLDEPIAGLDAEAEDSLLEIFCALRKSGKTIMMSTHDISSTLESFDLVMLLRCQPVAFGRPKEVLTLPNLTKAYGSLRVGMHLSDILGAVKWT